MNWIVLVVNNPYLIAALLSLILLIISSLLGGCRKFMSFVLFLVYIGGLIVLLCYCVILIPFNKFSLSPYFLLTPFITLPFTKSPEVIRALPFGILFSLSAVFLVAILLYLVLLAVLTVIDYSSGSIKVYDEYPSLSYFRFLILYSVLNFDISEL